MKVLFATEYFHPFVPGGTPWSLRILGDALVRAGVTVAVVTPNYGAAPRETIDGIDVHRFPFRRRLSPGPSLAPVRDHARPRFHLAVTRAALAVGRELGIDLVHAQEKHSLVGAYVAARRLGVPVVLSLRDFGLLCPIATCLLGRPDVPPDCGSAKLQRECAPAYLDAYIRGSRSRRLRIRAALAVQYLDACLKSLVVRRVDAVIGVSRSVLEVYGSARRVRAGQGRVVHNPASPPPVAPMVDRRAVLGAFGLADLPVVLFVGKRSPGKGFPVLLDAARRVARDVPATQFVVVGDGNESAVATGADVRILGVRPHGDVERLLSAADVYVHPAVWPEPFSRAILEAAASGTAIVATRTGGTPELLDDGVTALLVPPRDAAALAAAIVTLLRDPPLREKLGARAREVVGERFAPAGIARELLRVYGEIVRRAS
jgi:glycosyltransferase involved in cell wall biosynthesis